MEDYKVKTDSSVELVNPKIMYMSKCYKTRNLDI